MWVFLPYCSIDMKGWRDVVETQIMMDFASFIWSSIKLQSGQITRTQVQSFDIFSYKYLIFCQNQWVKLQGHPVQGRNSLWQLLGLVWALYVYHCSKDLSKFPVEKIQGGPMDLAKFLILFLVLCCVVPEHIHIPHGGFFQFDFHPPGFSISEGFTLLPPPPGISMIFPLGLPYP